MADRRLTTLAEGTAVRKLTHWGADKSQLVRDGFGGVFYAAVIDEEQWVCTRRTAARNKDGRCKRRPLGV
jgi:hypothetical protein